ncbi:MAG: hypothetical protein NXY59_01205 [Aigarchaeota archaeon]|nr:hypothetical protein [Candidatus Pelearchaeum maunauluense]
MEKYYAIMLTGLLILVLGVSAILLLVEAPQGPLTGVFVLFSFAAIVVSGVAIFMALSFGVAV